MMDPRRLLRRIARWLGFPSEDAVSILAVMPNHADRTAMRQISERAHWYLQVGDTFEEGIDMLRDREFAVILCDRDLPGVGWREAIAALVKKAPRTSVILTSPVNDDYLWQEVIRCGGYDVLTKPFQEERVIKTIAVACRTQRDYEITPLRTA